MANGEVTRKYQFITNNQALFCLQWKKNLFNHQKVSKYYEHDCSFDDFLKYIFKILDSIQWSFHCVKIAQMRSYFWSVFSCIQTEYGDLFCESRIQSEYRDIRTRNNSVFGHFSRSVSVPWKFFVDFRFSSSKS